MIRRMDPPTCGCTDCLIGDWSKPLDLATAQEILAMLRGSVEDATSQKFTAVVVVTNEYTGSEVLRHKVEDEAVGAVITAAEAQISNEDAGSEVLDPNLKRVIQTLMSTDDYRVRFHGSTEADLVYAHNDPPHPLIHITVKELARQPGWSER